MAQKKQSVLFVSDTHRGGLHSDFAAYEKSLIKKMAGYDHAVLIGDIFELFYVHDTDKKGFRKIIKPHLKDSVEFLENFVRDHPHTQVHFVLGNHENVRKFRSSLDRLQDKYPNFEWDPQAIRLGDALITHGDLQMSHRTDDRRQMFRLRELEHEHGWTNFHMALEEPGQTVVDFLRRPAAAVRMVHQQLKAWDGNPSFTYTHNREKGQTFEMSWVKNVFFGHTHVKFNNYSHEGILYHNTGSFTRVKAREPKDLGVLEATLNTEGQITDVTPVELERGRGTRPR